MKVGPTATKKDVLEQLLEQGMVLVALDARFDGVEVPGHLGRDAQLRLNLSYRFRLPMTLDEWGILATLTFAGEPFHCRFPWRSVFLLVSHVSGQPYLFPDDIPPELLSQATAEAGIDAQIFTSAKHGSPAPHTRPKLQLVRHKAARSLEEHEQDEEGTPDKEKEKVAKGAPGNRKKKDKEKTKKRVASPAPAQDDASVPKTSPQADAKLLSRPLRPKSNGRRRRVKGLALSPISASDSSDTSTGTANALQPVEQPTRVSLTPAPAAAPTNAENRSATATTNKPNTATTDKPDPAPTSTPDTATTDDGSKEKPPGGRPRKGSHLRLVK